MDKQIKRGSVVRSDADSDENRTATHLSTTGRSSADVAQLCMDALVAAGLARQLLYEETWT